MLVKQIAYLKLHRFVSVLIAAIWRHKLYILYQRTNFTHRREHSPIGFIESRK
jgi:hypothetical protein